MTSTSHLQDVPDNAIAIIGIGCRLAGANSPSELWENLVKSKDLRSEITRFSSKGFYHPQGNARKGLSNVKHGYLIEEGVDKFDNEFFSISPQEATAMDPQQRLLLEVSYEALENAGITIEGIKGSDTAVFTGIFTTDYHTSLLRDTDATPKYQATGTNNCIAANRISYVFDLHGPSLSLDTACSSTIVAMDQAVKALQNGDSRMAIVAGANIILNPDMFIMMTELGFLSPDGRSKSFDASGNGYGRGEGVLALLLKPLKAALAESDPIRAVIRGTRINQDGKTQGITLPSSEAQKNNMHSLYRGFDIDPSSVQYLEAHGAGTAVGDPLEVSAINAVFQDGHRYDPLIVGSIKSNVGHLEACAAMAGMVKTIMALEHGVIPPQLHFNTPNPKLDLTNILIPQSVIPWPKSSSIRRAGVNSFGFGGTNGHAVLDWGQPYEDECRIRRSTIGSEQPEKRPYLFKLSATKETTLKDLGRSYADYVKTNSDTLPLADLAHTLLARRSLFKFSSFIVADSIEHLLDQLEALPNSRVRSLTSAGNFGFIFTGQGAQWVQMGKRLLESSPIFSALLEVCDEALAKLPEHPSWSVLGELRKDKTSSRVYEAELSQPLCTAIQIALVGLWKSFGITPSAVVGHSSGEIAAAYAAGILSLDDAISVSYYRGVALRPGACAKKDGGMCAVGLGQAQSEELVRGFKGRVTVAAVNSPLSCTLSGDRDAIEEIVVSCKQRKVFCRALKVDMAYHSKHMHEVGNVYQRLLDTANLPQLASTESVCPMFSSVTGKVLERSECTASYWIQNLQSTVRFSDALSLLTSQVPGLQHLLEVGPHPALKGPAQDTVGKDSYDYYGSCKRGVDDYLAILETVSEMHLRGVATLNLVHINAQQVASVNREPHFIVPAVLKDLPRYAWDHTKSFWAESRASHNHRFRQFPRHEILGARTITDNIRTPSWRNILRPSEIEWLKDLQNSGVATLPSTLLLLGIVEAARQLNVSESCSQSSRIQNVAFHEQLSLAPADSEDDSIEIHTNVCHNTIEQVYSFKIVGCSGGNHQWKTVCTGSFLYTDLGPQSLVHQFKSRNPIDWALHESFGLKRPLRSDFIHDLSLDNDGGTGAFTNEETLFENYPIEPLLFVDILQLPSLAQLATAAIPAEYAINTIEAIELPLEITTMKSGIFELRCKADSPLEHTASITVQSERSSISVHGVSLLRKRLLGQQPKQESLFFLPKTLPDITCFGSDSVKDMALTRLLELVSHKYPACDIAFIDVPLHVILAAKEALGSAATQRRRFRSCQVVSCLDYSDNQLSEPNHVSLDPNLQLHLLMVGSNSTSLDGKYKERLRTGGFICSTLPLESKGDVERMFKIEMPQAKTWHLSRIAEPIVNGSLRERSLTVILPKENDSFTKLLQEKFSRRHEGINFVSISDIDIGSVSGNHCDTIVVDEKIQPLLSATSSSEKAIALLQNYIVPAKNVLWINRRDSSDPFNAVTVGALGSCVSECPALRAKALSLEGLENEDMAVDVVLEQYESMLLKPEEVESSVIFRRGAINITRFQPADAMSSEMGLLPPRLTSIETQGRRYEVTVGISNRQKPQLVVKRKEDFKIERHQVEIAVEASVFTHCDPINPTGQYGAFFVGNSNGSRFAGWAYGSHARTVIAPRSCVQQLLPVQSFTRSPSDIAIAFAASFMAITALEKLARVRRGDKFALPYLPEPFDTALRRAIQMHGALVVSKIKDADFFIQYDKHGMSVNRTSLCIEKYVNDGEILARACKLSLGIPVGKDCEKPLARYKEIDLGCIDLLSVMNHKEEGSLYALLMSCTPQRLFREVGVYVIAGGSGGLGREIIRWIAKNGAKHIAVLTRRRGSKAAMALHNLMQEYKDVKITIMEADASDSASLRKALNVLRNITPIRGVFNLATVNNDAAISTMSAEQWAETVDCKVKSSWNLHEHTICDNIEIFIMFSSISSIIGNRAQANYSTGNAFLNALAEFRQSKGLHGVAVALGMVAGVGLLNGQDAVVQLLRKSGLTALSPDDVLKIAEAALSPAAPPLIVSGLEMFEKLNGSIQAPHWQNQVFWSEKPEFGFVFRHNLEMGGQAHQAGSETTSLQCRLLGVSEVSDQKQLLMAAVGEKLGSALGYKSGSVDLSLSAPSLGMDSLSAIDFRRWLHQELDMDVQSVDILESISMDQLIVDILKRMGQEGPTKEAELLHMEPLTHRPLARSQRRLWFMQQFVSDKTVNNLLIIWDIEGKINLAFFRAAWTILMRRHEVLRSRIVDTEDGLQQLPVPCEEVEFSLDTVEEPSAPAETDSDLISQARQYVFNIEQGELIRGWLLITEGRTRFYLASNHLAWDHKSEPTIYSEVSTLYKSLMAGDANPESQLAPVPYQFIDYTLWHQRMIETQFSGQVDYWREELQGVPESVTLLPSTKCSKRPENGEPTFGELEVTLDSDVCSAVRAYCGQNEATPIMFFSSVLSALLSQLTGDKDIVLGVFDNDRGHSKFEEMIGFSVNVLPIRCRTSVGSSLRDLLARTRRTFMGAYRHRNIPLDYLLEKLAVPRRPSHNALFQVEVNYVSDAARMTGIDFGSFKFTDYEHFNARTSCDLDLELCERLDGRISCVFHYDERLYDYDSMTTFATTYSAFLRNALQNKNLQFEKIEFFEPKEHSIIRHMLSSHALGEQSFSAVTELVENACRQWPDKIAIEGWDSHGAISFYTFNQLRVRSNQISNFLIKQPQFLMGQTVGLYMQPTPQMVVALLGIVKAGGTYAPIDMTLPPDRIRYMVEDADINIFISDTMELANIKTLEDAGIGPEDVFNANTIWSNDAGADFPRPSRSISVDDTIYVLFTSGSTGRPKGVSIKHGQAATFMRSFIEMWETDNNTRSVLLTPYGFDVSFPMIFAPLMGGGTVSVASREVLLSPELTIDLVLDRGITLTILTCSQLAWILHSDNGKRLLQWSSLRHLIVGGELFTYHLLAALKESLPLTAVIWNAYGPTEATVLATCSRIEMSEYRDSTARIPIGKALKPARLHILDEHLRQLPVGYPGQLFIGGPNVSPGYLKRKELNSKVFIPASLGASHSKQAYNKERVYVTGDFVRLKHDGDLEYIGRLASDRQVKIRGQRTELSEIDSAIHKAANDLGIDVDQVAVVLHLSADGPNQQLVAYYTNHSGEPSDDTLNGAVLKQALSRSLPIHMVPTIYECIDEMPRNSNQKLDYRNLAARKPRNKAVATPSASMSKLSGVGMVIAEAWQAILHLEAPPGADDKFFEIGGHSLELVTLQKRILETLGAKIALVGMFTHSSVKGMEQLVLEKLGSVSAFTSDDQVLGHVDWEKEASLPEAIEWHKRMPSLTVSDVLEGAVLLTGAETFAGSHLLAHLLATTKRRIFCVAVNAGNDSEARETILQQQKHWGLPTFKDERIITYHGQLSDPALNLSEEKQEILYQQVSEIYHMASDVSLLKAYSDVRASNLGPLLFLLHLSANASSTRPKVFHYVSTWGVPHIQSFNDTKFAGMSSSRLDEQSMDHITPGSSPYLGYLKARWAAERLLEKAADKGLAVNIYRSSMCYGSTDTKVPLFTSDINRRVVVASLLVGGVPDIRSEQGGGQSWMPVNHLVKAMVHLGSTPDAYSTGRARIWNVVASDHVLFRDMAKLLQPLSPNRKIEVLSPEDWFERVRALPGSDPTLLVEVLRSWFEYGWNPFRLDCGQTRAVLDKGGIECPGISSEIVKMLIVGEDDWVF